MKKLLVLGTILTASVFTQASDAESVLTRQDYCGVIAEVSEQVMLVRQMGGDMQRLLNTDGASEVPFWQDIVMDAFKQPKYSTVSYQEGAVQEFRNQYFIKCMEGRLE